MGGVVVEKKDKGGGVGVASGEVRSSGVLWIHRVRVVPG